MKEKKKKLLSHTYIHIHSSEEREKDTYTPKDMTLLLFKIDD